MQRKLAEKAINKWKNETFKTIHTSLRPFDKFYIAENYHQKYYLQLTREIMQEYNTFYSSFSKFVDSTAAAKVNGYIKGYGNPERLKEEIGKLGLSEKAQKRLMSIVESY